MKRSALLVCVCLILSFCPLLYSQANGSFSGTVTDKTGSVISGATVKITSQATGLSREAKTDASGHYTVPLLPVSIYTVHVESQGFQAAEQKDLRLQVNEQREVDFTLNLASVTEKVEVSATEVAVQTTNPTLGQVITEQQVADLPLNGRDFVQLATLTPGTTQETNPNSFFNGGPSSEVSTRGTYSLSVGGSRAQSTDWLFDNVDNNELTAGGIGILPSIDAIQEFKVLTYNYSAEYGTRAGPTVLVTTKSGSNQYHGTVFEFFRNRSLNAKSFFAAEKEKFNLNQFGAALGGPIQKDKTFFFVDYEAKRQRRGIPFAGQIPTAAMMDGDFSLDPFGVQRGSEGSRFGDITNPFPFKPDGSPAGSPFQCDVNDDPMPANANGSQDPGDHTCNKIPANMFSAPGHGLIQLYPQSTPPDADAGINYTNVPVRKLNEGKFDVRLDHSFSTNDSVFARFSYDQADNFIPGGSPGFADQGAFASTQFIENHGRHVAISETHIFNDRNINQFTAGFNRIFNHIKSFGDGTCAAANLGIPGANINSKCPGAPEGVITQSTKDCVSCGLTSILMFGGYWSLGDRGFAPFQGGTNVFSVADTFDMIRGKHNIRVGAGFRAHQMNVMTNAFQDGFYLFFGGNTGDPTADLLLGLPGGAIHDQTFQGATTGRRWKMFRPFVQDDWRVTSDLTLNLGLAWALVTPITEARNRQANFNFNANCSDPPACNYLIPGVNSDGRVGIEFDKTALEPRIGLAWKVLGRQNTVFRAGYAIFHDSAWNLGAQGLWENPPFFAESDQFPPPCPGFGDPACGISGGFPLFTAPPDPANFTGTIRSQNLDFKQGRVQQFNFNIEHQLPGNVVLTAGYAGSRSHHILTAELNLNVSNPLACLPQRFDKDGNIIANPLYDPAYTLGCGASNIGEIYPNAPFGPFTVINNINDVGNARYDSFQVKAETKSSRHGLYALLGYTYARNFDSGFPDGLGSSPGATFFPLPGTSKADWALSQIQLNHNFTSSLIYDLPFGKGKQFGNGWSGPVNAAFGDWQITVIEKITSGFPIFPVTSANNSGVAFQFNGGSTNRPDQTCSGHVSNPARNQWFDTSCFSNPGAGKLGNANRAPLYGPGFVNTDLSFIKRFQFHERVGMDFRAEIFNLFNHTQFFTPDADVNSPNFGKINQTVNNPRLVQFALKLTF